MASKRIPIQFNLDDKKQSDCAKFLEGCGYRKNKILAILTEEFLENYNLNLEDITPEKMKQFLSSYEYLKGYKNNLHQGAVVYTTPIPSPASEPIIEAANKTDNTVNIGKNISPAQPEKTIKDTTGKIPLPTKPKSQQISRSNNLQDVSIDMEKANKALSVFGL